MTEHRYQARADIVSGQHDRALDRSLIGLVTLTLTDAGQITTPDGSQHHRPDVICHCAAAKRERCPAGCSSSPPTPTTADR